MQFSISEKIGTMLRITFIMILLIIMYYGTLHACCDEVVEVRSVKIKIIDKSTRLPLEGMPVYYTLRTYWPERLFYILRNPEGNNVKVYRAMEKYVSDSNGEVTVPSRKIALNRWKPENLYDENIYVNIDTRLESPTVEQKYKDLIAVLFSGKKDFVNPISVYRGYKIRSTTYEMDPKDYGGTKFEIADALWNGNGLLKKEQETFVVELERWDSQENTSQK
jgi:hypothetical protein